MKRSRKPLAVFCTFVALIVGVLGYVVSMDHSDPSERKNEESRSIPLLPHDVAIFGVASSAMDYSAKDLWFQTNENGEFRQKRLKLNYYPVLTRWTGDRFAIMKDTDLVVFDHNGEPLNSLPTNIDTAGMLKGTRSEDGKYVALLAHSKPRALILTDGQRTKAVEHPAEPRSIYVTPDGTAFSMVPNFTRIDKELPEGMCIFSLSLDSDLSEYCIDLPQGRGISGGVLGMVDGILELFIFWGEQEQMGWSLYRQNGDSWELVNEQYTAAYDVEEWGYVEKSFSVKGKMYFLTDKPGLVNSPFPDENTQELELSFHPLDDLITGSKGTYTIDGNMINYVFLRDRDLGAGQYLSAFNIDDPTKRVGPWEIPPEILRKNGRYTYHAVSSIFILDEKTRKQLGATD